MTSYQPTLNDRLYGKMLWEDESEFWFARIEHAEYGEFEVHIASDSPLNFLAVPQSRATYQHLLNALPELRQQAVREVFANAENPPPMKATHKRTLGEKFSQTLELFSITIYEDKGAEICSDSEFFDDTDDFLFVHVGADGELLEAAVDTH